MCIIIRHSLTACRCGTDIAKSTLEALSGMASDLFQNQQQKNTPTERLSVALKSMLKVKNKIVYIYRCIGAGGNKELLLLDSSEAERFRTKVSLV